MSAVWGIFYHDVLNRAMKQTDPKRSFFDFGLQRRHDKIRHDLERQLALVRVAVVAGEDNNDQLLLRLNCKHLTSVARSGNQCRQASPRPWYQRPQITVSPAALTDRPSA